MVRLKRFFKRFYLAILLFFLYLPILMLMVYSFNGGKTMAKWTGFSLNWYVELFKDPVIMEALGVTLSIALLSSLIAVVIGTLAAIGINEYKKWPKTLTINLTYVPMMNADIVTGISLLLLFIFMRIPRGYGTLLIAHTALIPELMPGIMTGFIMAFTMSFDDFVISFFSTQGLVNNLSTYIYSMARVGINPKINALSTIMFVCIITLLIVTNVQANRHSKKQQKQQRI